VRIAIVNQFFPPDLAPTAHLAASLARHRAAQGDEVTVVTSRGDYVAAKGEPAPRSDVDLPLGEGPGRIRVVRLHIPGGGKSSILTRLEGYAGFTAGAWARLATMRSQDVVVSLTTPPYIALSAMAHRAIRRHTRVVLWSMDVYPDAAERFGQIDPDGRAARVLRRINRSLYPRLDHLVVLDDAMRDLLADRYCGAEPPPTSLIPNWESVDLPDQIAAARRWEGFEEPALAGRFVVAYLGNTGTGHRFDAVVEAAGRLDDGRTAFLFVGGGVRWPELETAAAALGPAHRNPLVLHGYVDKQDTPGILTGADAALITLDDRAKGVMSPSKLHSCLAAGLPILYVGPEGTNVDDAIRRFGCGVSLRNGDVEGIVAAVSRWRDDPEHRASLEAAARHAFDSAYNDAVTLPQFDTVIDGDGPVIDGDGPDGED
jgi:colanic acid biosynthesis glycosyl transferase WcaI